MEKFAGKDAMEGQSFIRCVVNSLPPSTHSCAFFNKFIRPYCQGNLMKLWKIWLNLFRKRAG